MFNNEQYPLDKNVIVMPPETPCVEAARSLAKRQAVCVPFKQQVFLFTYNDLFMIEAETGTLADFAAGKRSLASPVVVTELPFPFGEWIDKLPSDLQRPVVFQSTDGSVHGYGMPGDLIKRIWQQKIRTEAYFRTLAETVTDAVTAVDRNGSVICWNGIAEDIYGIPQQEIVGRRIGEHFDADSLMVMRILDEGRLIRNTYHRPREGTHVLINASPILDPDGAIIGGLASEQDITHLVKLNEELSSAHASIMNTMSGKDDPFSLINGQSDSISKVVRIGKKVAESDTPVLLCGETGTGKEQLAEVIHLASARSESPFMAVNCGAAPAGMLESELFGFQGGAFSGQESKQAGKLESASGGTLLLNEIDKLPLDLQDKLYHAIKRQAIIRVGGQTEIPVKTRIIGATNQDLKQLVANRRFRPELYYALSVVSISLPPLRDRKEDIAALFQMYLREFSLLYQKPIPVVEPEVMLAFSGYDWPGNITELRTVVERCVILSEDDKISLELLPDALQEKQPQLSLPPLEEPDYGPDKILKPKISDDEESMLIGDALAKAAGNKSTAAKMLGISRGTLYNKMKKYNLT